MPFKSKQQEKWMWATHPQMARQWEEHTPKNTALPDKVKAKKPKVKDKK
jgi:hypothetical protein